LLEATLDKARETTVILVEPEGDMTETEEASGVVFSTTLTSDSGKPKIYRERRSKHQPKTSGYILQKKKC
jgi:hypothetical protein